MENQRGPMPFSSLYISYKAPLFNKREGQSSKRKIVEYRIYFHPPPINGNLRIETGVEVLTE